MGCGISKQKNCKQYEGKYLPSTRSFKMNVYHPPISKGDTYHVVALTSSTLGSIKLDPPSMILNVKDLECIDNDEKWRNHYNGICEDVDIDMNEAKALSRMIDHKIPMVGNGEYCPKTPITTSPGEPESIDVDDLMEGLEGYSPLRSYDELGSFSFNALSDDLCVVDTPKGMPQDEGLVLHNETWFDAQEKENNVPNEIRDLKSISLSRKEFQELSPTNPFFLKDNGCDRKNQELMSGVLEEHLVNGIDALFETNGRTQEYNLNGDEIVEKMVDVVVPNDGYDHGNGLVERLDDGVVTHTNDYPIDGIVALISEDKLSSKKERVILYFTSLRGVRKTYEDCCYVKLTLKGYQVRVDERDVSMHSGFKEELRQRLGEGFKSGLPKVFVGERYIGGVEEMRKLHEDGQLEKVLRDCESLEDDSGNLVDSCEVCGDIRFVPCETCSGSCKIYYECEDSDEDYEEDEYGFQRCPDCNENGLIRCPFCCD